MIVKVARRTLISTPGRLGGTVALLTLVALAAWASLEWAGAVTAVGIVLLGGIGILWMGGRWYRQDEAVTTPDAHDS